MTSKLVPPIKDNMFLTGYILSPPWVQFFINIGKILEAVESGTVADLSIGETNPTHEDRITVIETELEIMMEQLDTVVEKLVESYRLMEEINTQLMINNHLLMTIANASAASLGMPLNMDRIEDLREIM
jgi:hypothetical protein